MIDYQQTEQTITNLIFNCYDGEEEIEILRKNLSMRKDFSLELFLMKASESCLISLKGLKEIVGDNTADDSVFMRVLKQYSDSMTLKLNNFQKMLLPSTDKVLSSISLNRPCQVISESAYKQAIQLIQKELKLQQTLENLRISLPSKNFQVFQAFDRISNGKTSINFEDLQKFLILHGKVFKFHHFEALLRRILMKSGERIGYKEFFEFVTPFFNSEQNSTETIRPNNTNTIKHPPLLEEQTYPVINIVPFNPKTAFLLLFSQIKKEETDKQSLSLFNCITLDYINSIQSSLSLPLLSAESAYQIFCPLDPDYKLKLKSSTSQKSNSRCSPLITSIVKTSESIQIILKQIQSYCESSLAATRGHQKLLNEKSSFLEFVSCFKLSENDKVLAVHRLGLND